MSTKLSSTLTSLGTAILLVSLAFILERTFVRDIGNVASTAASRAVDEATAELNRRTDQLTARMDEVQDRVRARLAEVSRIQDDAIAGLRLSVSFERVARALAHANSMGALEFGDVVVPASADVDGPRLRFRWGYHHHGPLADGRPRLQVVYEVERKPEHAARYSPAIAAEWSPRRAVEDVGAELINAMRKAGFSPEASQLDLTLALRHLVEGVGAAISGMRSDQDSWIASPLVEVVAEGLVITRAGIESIEGGLVAAGDGFPERPIVLPGRPREAEARRVDLPTPVGVDEATWRTATRRAALIHPIRPGRLSVEPPWTPASREPTPAPNTA